MSFKIPKKVNLIKLNFYYSNYDIHVRKLQKIQEDLDKKKASGVRSNPEYKSMRY